MNIAKLIRRFVPLSADAKGVRREGLTYLNRDKLVRLEAEIIRCCALPMGDFAEFGVALGGSAILLAKAAVRVKKQFVGFDVFEMIPAPTSENDDEKSTNRYKVIASGAAQGIKGQTYYGYVPDLYSKVRSSFADFGIAVDDRRVRLVKGLFEDTLPHEDLHALALAHIDCDWYDPVRYCLASIADRIVPGGAIVVDDYNDYGGCRIAVDEFLRDRHDFQRFEGSNLILRRIAAPST